MNPIPTAIRHNPPGKPDTATLGFCLTIANGELATVADWQEPLDTCECPCARCSCQGAHAHRQRTQLNLVLVWHGQCPFLAGAANMIHAASTRDMLAKLLQYDESMRKLNEQIIDAWQV